MNYFIKLPLEIIATIVAYITNPIICLFANEKGELPEWAKWWGTFDNLSLDISWMIDENIVPKFAQYDYHKHYIYYYEEKEDNKLIPGHVDIIDPNFTLKEKFQRYICRLCWLYRNTNYGFSYFVNGVEVDKDKLIVVKKQDDPYELCICYESGHNLWSTPWCIFMDKPYTKKLRLRVYLGWKLKGLRSGRHMLAFFISPFRIIKK